MISGEGEDSPADGKNKIIYKFFKKTMVNRLTIWSCSAVHEQTKGTTMVSEILLSWKRTSDNLAEEVFNHITRQFMKDLIDMGHSESWRRNVLQSALKGCKKIMSDRREGKTERNR